MQVMLGSQLCLATATKAGLYIGATLGQFGYGACCAKPLLSPACFSFSLWLAMFRFWTLIFSCLPSGLLEACHCISRDSNPIVRLCADAYHPTIISDLYGVAHVSTLYKVASWTDAWGMFVLGKLVFQHVRSHHQPCLICRAERGHRCRVFVVMRLVGLNELAGRIAF